MKKLTLNIDRCSAIMHTEEQYKKINIIKGDKVGQSQDADPIWCTQYMVKVDLDVAMQMYTQLKAHFEEVN